MPLLLAAAIGCSREIRSSYATREEAEKAQAIQKGWIPSALPRSSRNIEETHDLDTNLGAGSFEFDPKEGSVLRRELRLVAPDELDYVIRQFGVARRLESHGYYKFEDFLFDVDWENSKARFQLQPQKK